VRELLQESGQSTDVGRVTGAIKAKFHYASWFEAGSEMVRTS